MAKSIEVVITGASSGLGAALAKQYAKQGKNILLIGRREAALKKIATTLQEQHCQSQLSYLAADLSKPEDAEKIIRQIKQYDQLDTLINNAGYNVDGRFHQVGIEKHNDLMQVHMNCTVRFSHAALPAILENQGAIINTASIAAFIPTPLSPLYGATKLFIKSFTDALHANYAKDGVRAMSICPGFFRSQFHQKLGIDPEQFYKQRGLYKAFSADEVAEQAMRDLNQGKSISIKGLNYKIIFHLVKLAPVWLVQSIAKRATQARANDKAIHSSNSSTKQ